MWCSGITLVCSRRICALKPSVLHKHFQVFLEEIVTNSFLLCEEITCECAFPNLPGNCSWGLGQCGPLPT
jgi:hypothetical protein